MGQASLTDGGVVVQASQMGEVGYYVAVRRLRELLLSLEQLAVLLASLLSASVRRRKLPHRLQN